MKAVSGALDGVVTGLCALGVTAMLAGCGGDGWENATDLSLVTLTSNDWRGSLIDVPSVDTLEFTDGCAVLTDTDSPVLPVFSADATPVQREGNIAVRLFDDTLIEAGRITFVGSLQVHDLAELDREVLDPARCRERISYTGYRLVLASAGGEN